MWFVLGGILAAVAVIIGGASVIYNVSSNKSKNTQQTNDSEKSNNKNDDDLTNDTNSVDENNLENDSSFANNGSLNNNTADNSGSTIGTNANSYDHTAENAKSLVDNSDMNSSRSSDFYIATSQNTKTDSSSVSNSNNGTISKIIRTFEKKIEDIARTGSEKSNKTNNSKSGTNESESNIDDSGRDGGAKGPSKSENASSSSNESSNTRDGSGESGQTKEDQNKTGKDSQDGPGQASGDNPTDSEKPEDGPAGHGKSEDGSKQNSYHETASIYAWGDYTMVYGEAAQNVYTTLKSLKVNSIYQNISNMNDTDNLSKIISGYKENGIDVYRLIGHYSWAYDNVNDAKRYVDSINNYNQKVNESSKIKGVVFDIEPHQNPNWKRWNDEQRNVAVSKYTDNMIELYNYSKRYGLEVVICIPYWFEKFDSFDRLFKDAADTYSVMNYTKRGIVRHISEEIVEAEKYSKKVEQISNVGHVGSEDITSYRDDGMQKLLDDQKQILDTYPYDGLRVSFHQYKTILDIL